MTEKVKIRHHHELPHAITEWVAMVEYNGAPIELMEFQTNHK